MASKENPVGQLEEWVPPDFGRKRPRRRPAVTRTASTPRPSPVTRRATAGNGAGGNGAAQAAARDWVAVTADPDHRRLEDERKEAEEKTRAAEERARLAEREVERLRRQLAAPPARRPGHKRSSPSRKAAKSNQPAEPGPIDLNAASFEALRALGLSVTQSARVISQREQGGGFRSLEDIDNLYGLPQATRAFLRENCRV